MITRRDLFVRTLQLVAAGTLISSLPGKLIAATFEVATDDYDIALDLAQQVMAETKLFWVANGNAIMNQRPPLAVFHAERVCATGETLINFMCDKFPPTMTEDEVAAVKHMFMTRDARKLVWQREPRVMFGALFTIAIVSELITSAKAPFNTGKMRSFQRFAEQYQGLIMGRRPVQA